MVCARCGEHFEPGDGFCPHCSQPEPAVPEGCVYCRDAAPVLCEGYCVHCGREVLPGKAGLTGSATITASNGSARLQATPEDSQPGSQIVRRASLLLPHSHDCHDSGIQSDLTYSERLSVAWLLIWRGSIVTAAISLVAGLLVWISALRGRTAIESLGVTLSLLSTLLLGVFVVMPWLVRTMVKKRFRGFSLVVLREEELSDT